MTAAELSASPAQSFDLLRMDREIHNRETRRRLAKTIGWTGLIAVSISRGGVLGWLLAGAGVYGLVHELSDWRESRPEWKRHMGPAHHGVLRRLFASHGRDVVDQSELSFPASDPPARASH